MAPPAVKDRQQPHAQAGLGLDVWCEPEAEAALLCLSVVQPQEVRGAIGLLKINAPIERVLGHVKNEWSWGAREIERIEKLAAGNRLSGTASSRKGRRG